MFDFPLEAALPGLYLLFFAEFVEWYSFLPPASSRNHCVDAVCLSLPPSVCLSGGTGRVDVSGLRGIDEGR